MKIEKCTLEETGKFSGLFLDYISQKDGLASFYNQFPTLENLNSLASERSISKETRITLQKVVAQQYASLTNHPAVERNIHALEHTNVYTVTTGHQLNIFTGPLYFIYKIITTINLAEKLKAQYPDKYFVPVYWMASEDHDFEEISYFHLFGKKYQWETDQKGAVGRFRPASLNKVIAELPEPVELFEKAYLDHTSLAKAVRYYCNELFGKYGLIVLDADNRDLKGMIRHIIADDIDRHSANQHAEATSAKLRDMGYSPQVFPREINFFYMSNGTRERIVKDGESYMVLNTDLVFTRAQLQEMIDNTPEVFSPNVVLRPLYQEAILPNIAYIGGPAELAYWLQLKGIFDHFKVDFPALVPRNFALYISKAQQKKLENLHFAINDLFKPLHKLKEIQLKAATENDLTLTKETQELKELFDSITTKAEAIDKTLTGFIGATYQRVAKEIDNIEKRLKKAEERNQETTMAQVEALKEKLFPGGSLQERHDNFLNFYLNKPTFIEEVKDAFDPLDFRFLMLLES